MELLDIIMSQHIGEFCRICGKLITKDDLDALIYAGYSTLGWKTRSAHKECWDKNVPKSEWVYPIDEDDTLP